MRLRNYCTLKEVINDREIWEIVIDPKTQLNIHIEEEQSKTIVKREPCFYWHFVDWTCISCGFHVDFFQPNFEIHLPFGFFRFGWLCRKTWKDKKND